MFRTIFISHRRYPPLVNLPDGDLAVMAPGATEDVAVLGGAQGVDGVRVGLQLLLHHVAAGVHHQHLAPQLAAVRPPEDSVAPATDPDLWGGDAQRR